MSVRGAHGCAFHLAEYLTLQIILQKYDYMIFLEIDGLFDGDKISKFLHTISL